jgi:hypothetical protein
VSVLGPGASPQVLASKARPSSKLARKARITPPANPVKSEGYFTTSITPPGWGVRRVIPSVPRLLPPHCLWVSVANPSASPSESHPYDLAPPNSHGITSLRKNRGGGGTTAASELVFARPSVRKEVSHFLVFSRFVPSVSALAPTRSEWPILPLPCQFVGCHSLSPCGTISRSATGVPLD